MDRLLFALYAVPAIGVSVGVALIFGLASGGFNLSDVTVRPFFNTHPLMMSVAFSLFLLSVATFRGISVFGVSRESLKWVHFALVAGGFLSVVGGGVVILMWKIQFNFPHLATPHAVIGLVTMIMLVAQVALGVAVFLFRCQSARSFTVAFHKQFGASFMVTALLASLVTGMTRVDASFFTPGAAYTKGMSIVAVLSVFVAALALNWLARSRVAAKSSELGTPLLETGK